MDPERNNLASSEEDEVQHPNQEAMPTRDGSLPRLWNRQLVPKQLSPLRRFITAFKHYVGRNPVYYVDQKPEMCIGCLQVPADVKINRRCIAPPPHFKGGPPPCQQCNCRVLWCASCMARWWAARQDGQADRWLAGRATCPMCRASFCLLDVSLARVSPS